MKKILCVLPLLLAFCASSYGEEKTLTGNMTCEKCGLNKAPKCQTVFVAKDGDKEVVYKVTAGVKHGDICTETKAASVTGELGKEGEVNTIKVSKVEYK